MTLQQAADKAHVDPMTVRRWIKAGKVAATKTRIGGNEVWDVANDFVSPNRTATTEPAPKDQDSGPSRDVLVERIRGLENENQLIRDQLAQKDDQIRALLATNAHLVEKESAHPLTPSTPATRPGRLARIFNKS